MKTEEDVLCFVQFMHPGGEHGPDKDSSKKGWNCDDHKRKFLRNRGRCTRNGEPFGTELVFWGEWEPESDIECIPEPLQIRNGPKHIHSPYYIIPSSYAGLQNTDPFIFEKFLYGICQQHTSKGSTQLRYLARGSVILFGSYVEDDFALDTVFVIRGWREHNSHNYKSELNGCSLPPGYEEVALNPLYQSSCGNKPDCMPEEGKSYRLYFGATYDEREEFEGMFSFFPCLPYEKGGAGFPRPKIRIPGVITGTQRQGKKLNPQTTQSAVCELWQSVKNQVLEYDGLHLGTYAQMPPKRTRRD